MTEKTEKKSKMSLNLFFYIGYFLLIMTKMWQTVPIISKYAAIFKFVSYGLILLFDSICFLDYFSKRRNGISKNELITDVFMLALAGVAGYEFFNTGNTTLIELALIVPGMRFLSFEKVLSKVYKYRLVLMSVLLLINILGDTIIPVEYVRHSGFLRETLGFIHPNTLGFYTVIITLEMFYVHRKNPRILEYGWLLAAFLINIVYSDSRTALVILALFSIGFLLRKWLRKIWKSGLIKWLVVFSFVIFMAISVLMALYYDTSNQMMVKISSLLSSRLDFYHKYIELFGVSLFGVDIFGLSTELVVLDNTYLLGLINLGIVPMVFVAILIMKSLKKSYDNKQYALTAIMVLLLAYGLMENYMTSIVMNTFLLSLGNIWRLEAKND